MESEKNPPRAFQEGFLFLLGSRLQRARKFKFLYPIASEPFRGPFLSIRGVGKEMDGLSGLSLKPY